MINRPRLDMWHHVAKIPLVAGKVKIKDFGIIKEAEMNFGPKLNIIAGKNASGKTTALNYLIENSNLDKLSKSQQIGLQIKPGCLLIDHVLSELQPKNCLELLKELENSENQSIVTLPWEQLREIKDKVHANILYTHNFELKHI